MIEWLFMARFEWLPSAAEAVSLSKAKASSFAFNAAMGI